jgi:hypothetical protein
MSTLPTCTDCKRPFYPETSPDPDKCWTCVTGQPHLIAGDGK